MSVLRVDYARCRVESRCFQRVARLDRKRGAMHAGSPSTPQAHRPVAHHRRGCLAAGASAERRRQGRFPASWRPLRRRGAAFDPRFSRRGGSSERHVVPIRRQHVDAQRKMGALRIRDWRASMPRAEAEPWNPPPRRRRPGRLTARGARARAVRRRAGGGRRGARRGPRRGRSRQGRSGRGSARGQRLRRRPEPP